MSEYLHIVCFDAPSPPNYGGAIELFYKIESLAKAGKKIILHYFDYRQNRNLKGLEKYCVSFYSYKRRTGLKGVSLLKPYIVSSRINNVLIENLNRDEYPVLLEGIHCCGLLPYINHNNRKIIVRIHNNEARYYQHLAASESHPLKKLYYMIESMQLKVYQKTLPQECTYLCLSQTDQKHFEEKLHLRNVRFIPCFIPWQTLACMTGKGDYCLYHGNLSVAENVKAAVWLVKHVFSEIKFPLVISGKNIPATINKLVSPYSHISLNSDPTDEQLSYLIENAHINLLPAFNNTGVKLKLLHALFQGRFCISNATGVNGSGIENGIIIADGATEWGAKIKETWERSFTKENCAERAFLLDLYNNQKNAQAFSALS